MRSSHRLLAGALFSLVAATISATEVRTMVRVFHLENASVQEASSAIQPLLTDAGSLTVQPRQARITVQDRPEVVARIARVIELLDRARKGYRLQVELLEGSERELRREGTGGAVDPRLRRMFPYAYYRRIGSATVEGELGEPTSVTLGGSFRLSFVASTLARDTPFGVPDLGDRVHLEQLRLVRLVDDDDGTRREVEVLRTAVSLSPGQRAAVGASASETSERGLVLLVTALRVAVPAASEDQ